MRALFDQIKVEDMNTSMTINAPARICCRSMSRWRTSRAAIRKKLQGTTQNDIIKEYSVARHLRLPAQAFDAADRRHGGMVLHRNAKMESAERLQLSPAGSRRDAGTGTRLRAGHRLRRARHGESRRAGAREKISPPSSLASPSS
jgi:hypothetical protein